MAKMVIVGVPPYRGPPMYRYSPHPIESYFIQGLEGRCEAGVISKLPKPEAVWNLFWLSTPLIDNLPGAGSNWLNVYKPTTSGLAAIVSDIIFDKCLREQLLMHPTKFAAWISSLRFEIFIKFHRSTN